MKGCERWCCRRKNQQHREDVNTKNDSGLRLSVPRFPLVVDLGQSPPSSPTLLLQEERKRQQEVAWTSPSSASASDFFHPRYYNNNNNKTEATAAIVILPETILLPNDSLHAKEEEEEEEAMSSTAPKNTTTNRIAFESTPCVVPQEDATKSRNSPVNSLLIGDVSSYLTPRDAHEPVSCSGSASAELPKPGTREDNVERTPSILLGQSLPNSVPDTPVALPMMATRFPSSFRLSAPPSASQSTRRIPVAETLSSSSSSCTMITTTTTTTTTTTNAVSTTTSSPFVPGAPSTVSLPPLVISKVNAFHMRYQIHTPTDPRRARGSWIVQTSSEEEEEEEEKEEEDRDSKSF